MKKIYLIALAIVSFSFVTSAQKVSGSVKGVLLDSISATPLSDATVSVVRIKDSTLISFSLTGSNGSFEIKNLDPGEYNLVSSFTGLQTSKKPFTISASQQVADLGAVKMDRIYKTMQEVVIEEAPVKINGDTLSFKADAFKTKPNATVEDLLKKVPGMTVDKDGTVKAQGEQVQKVYVDGKEFFSNDPKLATKNLTADMVDRVDVFDDMSEQAKFNGIDDGSRSKSINLKLKKDKKKGLFGKAYGGYGTDDRYDAGITANYFKGAMQSSIIAKTNNTNNMGFTLNDMIGMFGGGGGMSMGGGGMTMGGGGDRGVSLGGGGGGMMMMGGAGATGGGINMGSTGSGITSSSQAGLNYRDTWSKFFDVNGSYSFNHAETNNLRKSLRQTFATDTTYFTDQQRNSYSSNNNHRFNLNMVYSIDSFNSIIYNPNISFQKSVNNSDDTTSYYYSTPVLTKRTNDSRSFNNGTGDGMNWTNNLIWRKKFRTPGRTLSVNLSNTMSDNDRENYNFIKSLVNPRNVFTTTDGESRNYTVGFSYTEPIARNKVLEFNYSYNRSKSESDKEAYSFNSTSGKYDIANVQLSNNYNYLNEYHRAGANFRVVQKKYNYQIGFAAQQTTLENTNITKASFQAQEYTNFFPTASFNYQFARSKSFRFGYRGSTRQPSITQLQDVLDISNTPYFYKGNPNLKQEFANNFNLSYNNFDIVTFRNFFAFINFSQTSNKIANSVTVNPLDGTQLTVPVNLDGAYMVSGNFNFGFPIKQLQGGNFNTTTRVSYNRDPSLYNGKKNLSKNLNLAEDLRLNYNYKDKLDLGIVAGVNYTSAQYTQSTLNNDQSYFTHNYSADITYTMPKGFTLATDFDYTFYTGRTDGYNQSYAMWNASFAKELFKNKRGEIKASVFDILNQNRSVTRTPGANYIEDVENSTLKRFFMLTFTYRINRMGGKQMPVMMDKMTKGMRF